MVEKKGEKSKKEKKKVDHPQRGRCVKILYLTNTVQGNTQLTRIHGLHRKKKLKRKIQYGYSQLITSARLKESLYT